MRRLTPLLIALLLLPLTARAQAVTADAPSSGALRDTLNVYMKGALEAAPGGLTILYEAEGDALSRRIHDNLRHEVGTVSLPAGSSLWFLGDCDEYRCSGLSIQVEQEGKILGEATAAWSWATGGRVVLPSAAPAHVLLRMGRSCAERACNWRVRLMTETATGVRPTTPVTTPTVSAFAPREDFLENADAIMAQGASGVPGGVRLIYRGQGTPLGHRLMNGVVYDAVTLDIPAGKFISALGTCDSHCRGIQIAVSQGDKILARSESSDGPSFRYPVQPGLGPVHVTVRLQCDNPEGCDWALQVAMDKADGTGPGLPKTVP